MFLLAALVRWSLKNRPVVMVLTLLFLAIGLRSAAELSIDAVPDVTTIQVQVITAAPALSPVEMEQHVTIPVERAMSGIPHTTQIRSLSRYGVSLVTIVFEDGTDLYLARQLVNERMQQVQRDIPAHYGRPEMGPITSGLGEVFQFSVQNENLSLMQLQETLNWMIAPALRSVPGVVEVNTFGGQERQYQVILSPAQLQATGVSVSQVLEAIDRSNASVGGGYIEHNREHFLVGTDGLVKSLEDLQNVVVATNNEGTPITIAMLGEVKFGPRLRRGAATMDGKGETVVGVAMMLFGANSRTTTAALKEKLKTIEPSLPQGTRVEAFYDRSVLVDHTIHTVVKNLAEGALLVVVVLLLLLGDLRAGLVVAVVIPLSLLFAIIVMRATGLTGNLMSLGAVDFGLLVDGSVIIVENAVRRLSEHTRALGRPLEPKEHQDTLEHATLEVSTASVFGVAIITIVYLPMLALSGTEGKMFRPMALTVLLALGGAFLFSLTLVPVLASYLIKPSTHEHDPFILRVVQRAYTWLFRRSMRQRWVAVTIALSSLVFAGFLFTRVGAEFVPQLDEGDMLIEVRRLPGVSLSEAVQTDLRIEKWVKTINEVKHAVARAGSPEVATDPMGFDQSDVYLVIKDRGQWRAGLTKEKLANEITEILQNKVPEAVGGISQPIQMRTNELVAGVRSDVALLIYGPDLKTLESLGNQTADAVRQIPGAVDVRVEQVAGLRYLRVTPDRTKLARYGLSIREVNETAETLAVGADVGVVFEGDRRFGITVKSEYPFEGDLEPLLSLPLRSPTGQVVPLGDVAELAYSTGPAQVSREQQSRRLTVEFNVRGRDVMSVVQEAQLAVQKRVAIPTGYRTEWGGQFEHYSEAKARLSVVVPLALGLIVFLLWLAFRSGRAAMLIFMIVPFAAVGGVVALWLREIPFSVSAGVGFIALFGVAVLNGLVMVSFARQLQDQGIDHVTAVERAAELRLRPVLMTALVASLGFVPMALSTAPGAEVQRPLATVVIGGLGTATWLTLFVLPALYAWFASPTAAEKLSAKLMAERVEATDDA